LQAESLGHKDEALPLQICINLLNLNELEKAEQRALKMLEHENSTKNGHAELILAFVGIQKKDMNTARKYYQISVDKGGCPPAILQSIKQILEGN
jgi:Tfp pilus assembly protein PilF